MYEWGHLPNDHSEDESRKRSNETKSKVRKLVSNFIVSLSIHAYFAQNMKRKIIPYIPRPVCAIINPHRPRLVYVKYTEWWKTIGIHSATLITVYFQQYRPSADPLHE